MDSKLLIQSLAEQVKTMEAASSVLLESYESVGKVLQSKTQELTVSERESCEALTARFSRLSDFLFQRIFRTVDQIELQDEGTGIDRLNRMEKRGIINSAGEWREIRELRNSIAHEYLIESSDSVLHEAFRWTPVLVQNCKNLTNYLEKRNYLTLQK